MTDTNIRPLDLSNLNEQTGNVYATVAMLGKRANQVGAKLKAELNEKLAEFGPAPDSLEEVVENREQIEIAKHYEAMPKPALIAIEQMINGEIVFAQPDEA
jgi:hypothetical protein